MIYPAFLFLTVAVVVILLFTTVLPSFFELFESMEKIPVSTQVLMAVSIGLQNHFTEIAAAVGCAAAILAGIFTPWGSGVEGQNDPSYSLYRDTPQDGYGRQICKDLQFPVRWRRSVY